MWRYFKFELFQFCTNKKNIAVYLLLLFIVLFYAFKVAPAYDPIEKVDYDEIEARYLTRETFLQEMASKDNSDAHPLVWMAIEVFNNINPIEKRRLDALNSEDLKNYAAATGEWYDLTNRFTYRNDAFYYNPRYYTYGSQYANEDGFYAYYDFSERYKAFATADYELTIEQFEQRTALQTLERLLKGPLPILLIISSLLLSVDIVTKDRRNPTLLKGLPIADWKKLLVKGAVAFVGSVTLGLPIIIGLVILGIQFGFGHFGLPVPYYNYSYFGQLDDLFAVMNLGTFLAQCFGLLCMWFVVIITLVLLSSVIFRNEILTLGLAMLLIFAENFYFSRGVGYVWEIEHYPTSYIQIGQVVSRLRNFYYNDMEMNIQLGVVLLAISTIVLLILTLCISLNKRFKLIK